MLLTRTIATKEIPQRNLNTDIYALNVVSHYHNACWQNKDCKVCKKETCLFNPGFKKKKNLNTGSWLVCLYAYFF